MLALSQMRLLSRTVLNYKHLDNFKISWPIKHIWLNANTQLYVKYKKKMTLFIYFRGHEEETALHLAASYGSHDLIHLLLKNGASVDIEVYLNNILF